MSRSPYYARRRTRILKAVKRALAKDTGESESVGVLTCAICHVDLPVVRVGGLCFVQAGLGYLCKKGDAEVCALSDYLALGATKERDSAFSSDSDGGEVHSA